jgi:adenine-specific DNA-methyltransferase
MELTGKIRPEYKTEEDIRKGFVYKRVPHVTLKSIANNPDIKEGMSGQQIDAAIARHADTETLYDQPYEDKKRVRVCGPFSVESLSPHRVLSTSDENQDGTVSEQEARKQQDLATMILDNLRKAGVQNTRKEERLAFDRLDPYAGYFTGADEPYEKLKRALRADINEDAWSSLYSTVSRPFDKPASGKIAVKVINHFGDEMLKVFAV